MLVCCFTSSGCFPMLAPSSGFVPWEVLVCHPFSEPPLLSALVCQPWLFLPKFSHTGFSLSPHPPGLSLIFRLYWSFSPPSSSFLLVAPLPRRPSSLLGVEPPAEAAVPLYGVFPPFGCFSARGPRFVFKDPPSGPPACPSMF